MLENFAQIKMHGIVFSLCVLVIVTVSEGQGCGQSSQCGHGQCCRDVRTNATLVFDPSAYNLPGFGSGTGQCVQGKAGPREGCDSFCACPTGYECYQRATGVCCGAPATCITLCEARRLRIMERCFPPPMAPNPGPGGAGIGGADFRRRRRSLAPIGQLPMDWRCRLLVKSSLWSTPCPEVPVLQLS